MASCCTFSLAIPVLASLNRGVNGLPIPQILLIRGHSFHAVIFMEWLTHYFQTHHVLHPAPLIPLMVHYFGPLTKCNNIGDAHRMIHEGKVPKFGCLMLAKNRPEIILDDGKVDDTRSEYLVALRDGFLPVRQVHLSMWSPTASIGSVNSSNSVNVSLGHFLRVLAPEQCYYIRMSFTNGRGFYS